MAESYWHSNFFPNAEPISDRRTLRHMPEHVARTAFGERLYKARKDAKLSQAELAKRAGLTQGTVAALEREGRGSSRVAAIAQTTGVLAKWLADGIGPMRDDTHSLAIARDSLAPYLAARAGRDYRTTAHSLAAAIENEGISLTIRQFLTLVDAIYDKGSET